MMNAVNVKVESWYPQFKRDLFWAWLCCLVVFLVIAFNTPHDNTDAGSQRSGLHLYTDALTGCQYLSSQQGGITPRMGTNGKQVCGESR